MGPRKSVHLKEVCEGLVTRKFPMTYTFNALGQLEPHQHIISMKENVMEDFPNLLQELAAIAKEPRADEFNFDSNAHHYSSIPASWVKVGADDEVLMAYSAGRFVTHSFYEQLHRKYEAYFKDVTGEGPYITEEDFHKIVVPLVLQEQAKRHLAVLKTIRPSSKQVEKNAKAASTPKPPAQQTKQTSPRAPENDSKAIAPSTPKPAAQQVKQTSPRTPLGGIREADAEAGLPAPLTVSPLAKASVIPVAAVSTPTPSPSSTVATAGSPTVITSAAPTVNASSPAVVASAAPTVNAGSPAAAPDAVEVDTSFKNFLAKHPLFNKKTLVGDEALRASAANKVFARRALNTSAFGMWAFYQNLQRTLESGDNSHMRASAILRTEVSVILNPTKKMK